jgi:hypothetical protein
MSALTPINHTRIYLFGLMVMAVALPTSNLLMSLAQIIIGTNWVLEGQYKEKIKRFIANKPALIFTSIFGLHLIGLFHTANWEYAAWDLRNKVPLFVLPFLIISSNPLSRKIVDKVFSVFTISVLIATVICAGELTPINNWVRNMLDYPATEIMDARNISHFISHIRFALMICLSLSWLMFQVVRAQLSLVRRMALITISIWLTVFLFLMESVTGLAIVIGVGFSTLLYLTVKQESKIIKGISILLLALIPVLTYRYIANMVSDFYKVNEKNVADLPKYTASGMLYFHDLDNQQLENGNYVWRYVCHLEIEPEWEKRSAIPFKGKDKAGQFVEYTLFRYMTSRGLHKDAEGLAQMSDAEITAVEYGIANMRFTEVSSIESKIYGIIWQIDDYQNQGDPGGHSLTQRWEFWKAGLNLIKANLLIGVGTGDVYQELLKQYEIDDTSLIPAYRKHPHNQYLSIGIAFGLIGLLWFVFALLYPPYVNRGQLSYVALVFLAIVLLSMIPEDTLETQAGVSFVAFFYSLLLLSYAPTERLK